MECFANISVLIWNASQIKNLSVSIITDSFSDQQNDFVIMARASVEFHMCQLFVDDIREEWD